MCLTADPGVASSIPARSYTFVEIDQKSVLQLFISLPLIQEGLLSLRERMCTKFWLVELAHEKVWLGELTIQI